MTNPLVSERKDSTEAFTGVAIAESVDETAKAIESGDWAAGALGIAGTALDAIGMAMDPFGAVFAAGVGWLIEHVGPVSDALDSLTGDPDEIKAHADTWKNVHTELADITAELTQLVSKDTAGWTGEAGDAYRARAADIAKLLEAAHKAAEGAASGITTAGEIVGAVRTLVRDIIAELVGHLISWALQVVATLGIALTWVVPQVIAEVASVAADIAKYTTKLVEAFKKLTPLLDGLRSSFGEASAALKKIKAGDGTVDGPKPTPEIPPRSGGPAPTNTAGVDGGTPRGPAGTNPTGTEGSPPAERPTGPPPTDPPRGPESADPPGNSAGNRPPNNAGGSAKGQANPPEAHTNRSDQCTMAGDPISVTTGAMLLFETDVDLPGTLPLKLGRTHLSSYRIGRSFGSSWASTVDQRLELEDDGVYFVADDGMLLRYPYPDAGVAVLPVDGPQWPLMADPDGGYTIGMTEQDVLAHFSAGPGDERPITALANGSGHRIDFRRDDGGDLIAVDHSGGYHVVVDSQGGRITALRLRRESAEDVTLTEFGYDRAGRLVEVVNSSGQPMKFDYDAEDRVIAWEDRNGMRFGYGYDHAGRCVFTTGTGGYLSYRMDYDPQNRITRATNSLNETTTYHYNEHFQVVREVNPLGQVTESEWGQRHRLVSRTDPLGRTTRYDYDERGNLGKETFPDGSVRIVEYNDLNLPTRKIEPDGAVWRREYSDDGRMTAEIDPTGARTVIDYDERGALRSITDAMGGVTAFEVNAVGVALAVTDPTGATTRYDYDDLGRARTVTDALGGVTRLAWTPEGLPLEQASPDGAVTRWIHDGEGNLRGTIDPQGAANRTEIAHFDLPVAVTRPDGTRLEMSYDTELRLSSITNERGMVWHYRYDAAGNLVAEQDFDGRVQRYRHDAAGQLVERTNAAGQTVRFTRDVMGRIVQEQHDDGAKTHYEYDPAGRMVRARNADADLVVTYDQLGRVIGETINGRTVSSRYDRLGRRTGRRTSSGATSTWEYDAARRPMALNTAGRSLRFDYDAAGREVRRRCDSGVVLTQSWDSVHRLCSQTLVAGTGHGVQQRSYSYRADGLLEGVEDRLSGPRRYEHDRMGRITTVHRPNGTERYRYDPAGNLAHDGGPAPGWQFAGTLLTKAGSVRYEHDSEGRVVLRAVARPNGRIDVWRFGWNADDRLIRVLTPDGTLWRYGYDALGRRTWKRRMGPDGTTVVEQIDFAWDGAVVAEQVHNGCLATVWDWTPTGDQVVSQTERVVRDRNWVDRAFFAMITDLIGTPTEMVDANGNLVWHRDTTLWGLSTRGGDQGPTSLRFPGQYHDPETGLHYNFHRYYDPMAGGYLSHDPLGIAPAPNSRSYVRNPTAATDPLGLAPCKTFALDNQHVYLSGWADEAPPRFNYSPPDHRTSGYQYPTHEWDRGEPGRYYASHGEVQALRENGGAPIVVSRPVCSESCQGRFQYEANNTGNTLTVGDPKGIHQFGPNNHHTYTPDTTISGTNPDGSNWTMSHNSQANMSALETSGPGRTTDVAAVHGNDTTASWNSRHSDGMQEIVRYYPDKAAQMNTWVPDGQGGGKENFTDFGPAGRTDDYEVGPGDTLGPKSNVPPSGRHNPRP